MKRLLVLLALAAAALLSLPGPTLGTNLDCLACHEAGVAAPTRATDFAEPAVDRTTACMKCHWLSASQHPFHNVSATCGGCHAGWGFADPTRVPKVPTTAGWFYTSASASASAEELHAIHLTASWPGAFDKANSRCASCHAVSACESCHEDIGAHGDHTYDATSGTRTAQPWIAVTGAGTPVGDQKVLTARTSAVTCGAATCHDQATSAPAETIEDNSGRVTFTGSWVSQSSRTFSGGTLRYASVAGARASANLPGGAFSVIGSRNYLSGLMRVLVDGSVVATVDCGSATSQVRQVLYRGNLDAGMHTVAVEVVGQGGAMSSATRVYFDAFSSTGSAKLKSPSCASCHEARVADHGYEVSKHSSAQSCVESCHRDLDAEHRDRGLGCKDCHSELTGRVRAAVVNSDSDCESCHDVPSHTKDFCYRCHGGSLRSYPGTTVAEASKHFSATSSTKAATTYPGGGTVQGECVNCHTSHRPNAFATRGGGNGLCYGCHDAAGTTKPAGYSYRGRVAYEGSAHSTGTPGCGSCHAAHNTVGAPAGLDGQITQTCLGSGNGGCHASSANAAGRSNIASDLAASTDVRNHHDLTATSQAKSGSRIDCTSCHNPHRETATSKYSDPDAIERSITATDPEFARYIGSNGEVYALVSAQHDGIAPTISGVLVDTEANGQDAGATAPMIRWTTNEPATSWVEWGATVAYEKGRWGIDGRSTNHAVTITGLIPGMTYYFRVRSTDLVGNETVGPSQTYTAVAPPVLRGDIPDHEISEAGSVTMTWTPNVDPTLAPFTYRYHLWGGAVPLDYWSPWTSALATSSVSIDSGIYRWEVEIRDKNGNVLGKSRTDTFTRSYPVGGSCPFLFTWDGDEYAFEADAFVAGRLGTKRGSVYLPPMPKDSYVVRNEPKALDGLWKFKIVEERFETDYLDKVSLKAIDVPDGAQVYGEKPTAGSPYGTFPASLHTVRAPRAAISAKHLNTGADISEKIAAEDGDYLVLNEQRESGFTFQTLELDLGDVSSAPQVKILMTGVSAFPVTPAGLAWSAKFGGRTKLEVQETSGTWTAISASQGSLPLPPEFVRPFVFDLTKAVRGRTGKVRFTYLYKTYIDSIVVDTTLDEPLDVTDVPLVSADMGYHGVDEQTNDGDVFGFVYGRTSPGKGYFPGNYTKFGDVKPLLAADDDTFVICGQGDEISLAYEPLEPVHPGKDRFLVFDLDGYYKDAKSDLARSVEPLPFGAMSNYPYPSTEQYPADAEHEAYRAEWNTRVDGRDPVEESQLHYSVNSDYLEVQLSGRNFGQSVSAEAGWESVALPTPAAPGLPVSADRVERTRSNDASFCITDLAVDDRSYNHQMFRFRVDPAKRDEATDFALTWVGHGEPAAGYPTEVYLWNFGTSTWDRKRSADTPTDIRYDYRSEGRKLNAFCMRCHDGTAPAGVVVPAGVFSLGSSWATEAHGGGASDRRASTGGLIAQYTRGQGPMDCAVCHEPHGNGNLYHIARNVNGRSVTVRSGNEAKNLCYSCHTGNVAAWHAACLDCHDGQGGGCGYGYIDSPETSTFRGYPNESSNCLLCHTHGSRTAVNSDGGKGLVDSNASGCGGCHGFPRTF